MKTDFHIYNKNNLKISINKTFECFASVVPIRKLLSAQLSKTLVNRCLFFFS